MGMGVLLVAGPGRDITGGWLYSRCGPVGFRWPSSGRDAVALDGSVKFPFTKEERVVRRTTLCYLLAAMAGITTCCR